MVGGGSADVHHNGALPSALLAPSTLLGFVFTVSVSQQQRQPDAVAQIFGLFLHILRFDSSSHNWWCHYSDTRFQGPGVALVVYYSNPVPGKSRVTEES